MVEVMERRAAAPSWRTEFQRPPATLEKIRERKGRRREVRIERRRVSISEQ